MSCACCHYGATPCGCPGPLPWALGPCVHDMDGQSVLMLVLALVLVLLRVLGLVLVLVLVSGHLHQSSSGVLIYTPSYRSLSRLSVMLQSSTLSQHTSPCICGHVSVCMSPDQVSQKAVVASISP